MYECYVSSVIITRNMSPTSSAHVLFPHKMFVVSMRGMGWPTCQDLDSIFLERSGVVAFVESAEQALDVLFGGRDR